MLFDLKKTSSKKNFLKKKHCQQKNKNIVKTKPWVRNRCQKKKIVKKTLGQIAATRRFRIWQSQIAATRRFCSSQFFSMPESGGLLIIHAPKKKGTWLSLQRHLFSQISPTSNIQNPQALQCHLQLPQDDAQARAIIEQYGPLQPATRNCPFGIKSCHGSINAKVQTRKFCQNQSQTI